jgi:LSD1 subclass zinc finger protein
VEQADLQPTRPDRAFVKTFPCTGCGAKLSFAPGTKELRCEFCGTANDIPESGENVEELDFEAFLKALEGKMEIEEVEAVRCDKCGAQQSMAGHLFAGHCTFCGAAIVSKGYASRRIKPKSLVPFQVNRERAADAFRHWVKGLWLAPGDLKRYAQSDAGLAGVYLPYWTYDCHTASDYAGERGDDYYTTETYTTTDSSGKAVTQTRRVKHTRWTPAAGHVERFHDDVLVMASRSLPPRITDSVMRYSLKGLVPYQPEYVSGFQAEAYQVTLREGFPIAKRSIDEAVRELVRRDIGGDQQRIHSVSTRYDDVKFKHVLLPAWISAYRYRDKVYRFVINGQTGEVSGESPKSWWKIAAIALGVLILLVLVLVSGGAR